jgi:ADP-ribose pyrophosphatase YjhB (NUDIX family)
MTQAQKDRKPENRDMTLKTPFGTFNYRVGFLVFKADSVLLHKTAAGYWFVPGGRVHFGEPSESAVRREIGEEMQSPARSVDFAGTVENFFRAGGEAFHELMFLYRAVFADDVKIPAADIEGNKIESGWFTQDALRATDLKPSFLKERFFDFRSGTRHIVHNDMPEA